MDYENFKERFVEDLKDKLYEKGIHTSLRKAETESSIMEMILKSLKTGDVDL